MPDLTPAEETLAALLREVAVAWVAFCDADDGQDEYRKGERLTMLLAPWMPKEAPDG